MIDIDRWINVTWEEFPRTPRRSDFQLVLKEAYKHGQTDAAAEIAKLKGQIDDLQRKLTQVRDEVGSSIRAALLLIEDKQ